MKYYALNQNARQASIYIFGDIVDEEWFDSDVSAASLAKEIEGLDVNEIDVHINSYGGSVSSGLAIYNMLKNHKAKVKTYCDGFACSIASVIFMAGDERIMNEASLLMIHNAWMYTVGNAEQLRKDAADLDIISQASMAAYASKVNVTEDELKKLLDAETWLLPGEALEMGFATSIVAEAKTNKAAASAHKALFSLVQNGLGVEAIVETAAVFDSDEVAEKIVANLLKRLDEAKPQENKTLKFFNALMGGKE